MAKPRVISLFTGAGGLDYGLEAAGFETAVALEIDATACETLRANRSWPVIQRDILETSSDEILDTAGLAPGDADLLVGGPPCQPFSKAGYWSRGDALRLRDPRANTLSAYFRVLEDALPAAFVLENVEGLAYRNKDEGLRLIEETLQRINRRAGTEYRATIKVLNAADYGVPQIRKRLIIVGARSGKEFRFPEPTHHDDPLAPQKNRRRTAWDAIGNLRPPRGEDLSIRGKWAELLPSIPEGRNYLWHTDRMDGEPLFGWRCRYWSFLLKLAKAQPSWTIQAQPGPAIGPFHWENRRLSMREICRLQTFPDDVVVHGGRTAIQRQVGNAVPSLLAEVLGREIRSQLLGLSAMTSPPALLPSAKRSTPGPAEPEAVHPKYLRLRGRHAKHLGTGRGPRGQQMALL